MPADLLAHARKYNESALVDLLEGYYPLVHRMAYALCGDAALASRLIDTVLRRAINVLPGWRDDSAADRWFYRHTVQESRRYENQPRQGETLVDAGRPVDEYAAFVRTLRGLAPQQREAVLLHHGEHLNLRYVGVAMDCSADAAENHLRAGIGQLRAIAGDQIDLRLEMLAQAYRQLAPPPQTARPVIRRRVRAFLFPRAVRRWVVRGIVLLGLIAAIILRHRIGDLVEWARGLFK